MPAHALIESAYAVAVRDSKTGEIWPGDAYDQIYDRIAAEVFPDLAPFKGLFRWKNSCGGDYQDGLLLPDGQFVTHKEAADQGLTNNG